MKRNVMSINQQHGIDFKKVLCDDKCATRGNDALVCRTVDLKDAWDKQGIVIATFDWKI